MIATRFRSVGWTGCICAAALSFYLVSQSVAAKRAELASVDRRIMTTQREIGQLETEISTRGGMSQIEAWNSRVYGLQAPGAEQFVNSSVQLVAMANPQPLPLNPAIAAPHGPVQQASLTTVAPEHAAPAKVEVAAAADAPAPVEQPMIRAATFIEPKRVAMAPDGGNVHKASLITLGADDKAAIATPAKPAKAVRAEPEDVTPAVRPVVAKADHPKADHVKAEHAKADRPKAERPKADDSKADIARVVKRSEPKLPTRLTALDDNWLADVTDQPARKRSHKGRP